MNIYLLFGNRTKVDILKYLMFKEDGISARELENNLSQSFPAIKKQIDNLERAWIIMKNKKWNRWQLEIVNEAKWFIKEIFLYDIKMYIQQLLNINCYFLKKCFLVDFFSTDSKSNVWVDLVFIHLPIDEIFLIDMKKQLWKFFDSYFLDLKIVFMLQSDYEKRLRFADKFVIKIKEYENLIIKDEQ